MNLRPYQEAALDGIYRSWREFKRTLLVLPTGTGKTIVFSHVAQREVEQGRRVLILAHRDELLQQAADKLLRSTGLAAAVEKAGDSAEGSLFPVTVGSVQTLMRTKRLERFSRDHYDTVIVDEAHHCLSESYQRVLEYFSGRVLGVTATPDRGDKRNLGQYFEDIAFEYSMRDAIRDGFLCRIKAQTIPLAIDLGNVRVTAGDFNDADLGTALDPYLPQIAAAIPADRKTLVFLPLIATSQKMEACLAARGIPVRHVDGTSQDRRDVLRWFSEPGPRVVCNSMLLTEGFDEPSITCVVCLRPTKIRSLYAQIVGRGTRIHPGKSDLLILDFLWHTSKHELCHPACLVAEKLEEAAKMQELQEAAAGKPDEQAQLDLEDLEASAKQDVIRERERALAEELERHRRKASKTVDPLDFALSLHAEDLQFYEPVMPWQAAPPSDKQLEVLERFGFSRESIPSKGFASMLMDKVIARSRANLATPKQVNLLKRWGVDGASLTFTAAKTEIDRCIREYGWNRRVA